MELPFNLTLGLRAVRNNRLRSALTIAIIGLGITALVGILTATDVLKSSVSTNFSQMGANTFQITGTVLKKAGGGRSVNEDRKISYREAVTFKQNYPVDALVGISFTGSGTATVRAGSAKTNPNISVLGVDENYLNISETQLSTGRNFSDQELYAGSAECIIGSDIARKLFGRKTEQAIGSMVSVGEVRYRVIGIMEKKGGSMMMNLDNMVLVPLQQARSVFGGEKPYVISLSVSDVTRKGLAAEEAEGLFRSIRNLPAGAPSDFSIQQNDTLMESMMDIIRYVTWAALVIGVITVIGSVIGLMNIMLVSVAERTREIGISKALGARSSTIRLQFLTESVTISLLGGIAGMLTGILAGNLVSAMLKGSFTIPWIWMLLAVTLCALVGIISGLYPALKAARLDPIQALRYE